MAKRRRTKPYFKDEAADLETSLIDGAIERIRKARYGFVAIGLDMAADENNWGVAIFGLNQSLCKATIELVLPHRFSIEGFKAKHPIKPTKQRLTDILSSLSKLKIPIALAVDVPFGWPKQHRKFLRNWSAFQGATSKESNLPKRARFEYRLCDRKLKRLLQLRDSQSEQSVDSSLFAVGADKIASAAYVWAQARQEFSEMINCVDVGFCECAMEKTTLFETYPSAFVRLNYPEFAAYKTEQATSEAEDSDVDVSTTKIREKLWRRIEQDYCIASGTGEHFVELACATAASDAFDGLVCAICAWDYLRCRSETESQIAMTTPHAMLGLDKALAKKRQIELEGWILVRSPTPLKETAN